MPWDYSAEAQQTWRRMVALHNRTRPLMRKLWRRFLETGIPMTRPMYLADPDRYRSPRVDDQWMVGPNVLVAPVVAEGAVSRPVLLPKGCWREGEAGARLAGNRTITVDAPLGKLPWFTRCGTDPL
jgi:alpha-glucosidase (family GH31 glycosyl hydrolase)